MTSSSVKYWGPGPCAPGSPPGAPLPTLAALLLLPPLAALPVALLVTLPSLPVVAAAGGASCSAGPAAGAAPPSACSSAFERRRPATAAVAPAARLRMAVNRSPPEQYCVMMQSAPSLGSMKLSWTSKAGDVVH
jgi:hypothetical protein